MTRKRLLTQQQWWARKHQTILCHQRKKQPGREGKVGVDGSKRGGVYRVLQMTQTKWLKIATKCVHQLLFLLLVLKLQHQDRLSTRQMTLQSLVAIIVSLHRSLLVQYSLNCHSYPDTDTCTSIFHKRTVTYPKLPKLQLFNLLLQLLLVLQHQSATQLHQILKP